MAKTQHYFVAINTRKGLKFITSLGDHHTAYWEDGKDAMKFTKDWAKDITVGLFWNGYEAVTILDVGYQYSNPSEKENTANA